MPKRIGRRDFLTGVAGAAIGGMLAGEARARRKPNIIYILADDLGYGDLGCYGQKLIKTPHIDRLATEGIRFMQHYAGSTVCAPSRCCLMTGYHTGHCRIRGNKRVPLLPEDVTVAEELKRAGYTTALIGKWGLGEEASTGIPTRQGFDYFFGYLNQAHAHNYYPEFLYRNESRAPLRNTLKEPSEGGWGVAERKIEYSHDLFAQEALDFIDRMGDQPFFLYLALTIPHANNEAGKDGMEVPSDEPYTNESWPKAQKNHAAMISRMDADVGKIMARLRERGLDSDTVVMFSSDNGPHREGGARPDFFASSGPLRGIKRDMYEGGIRVPFIVRWPGVVRPGSESGHVSAFWDFPATAAEIAGIKAFKKGDGISFLPALTGRKQKEHKHLYWEFTEQGGKQAVRMGRWKGVRLNVSKEKNAPLELYDLVEDPGETVDVAGGNRGVVKKLAGVMKKERFKNEDFPLLKEENT